MSAGTMTTTARFMTATGEQMDISGSVSTQWNGVIGATRNVTSGVKQRVAIDVSRGLSAICARHQTAPECQISLVIEPAAEAIEFQPAISTKMSALS